MKRSLRRLALLAVFLAGGAGAQVYKWTDSQGRTQYGDRPPGEAKAEPVKERIQTIEGPARVDSVAALKRPRKKDSASARAAVAIYTATWCGVCTRAKAWMSARGIPYQEFDVERTEQGKRDFAAYGGKGVPLILVGEQRMLGFSESGLEAMLAQAAR